jgi:hypothetical protein
MSVKIHPTILLNISSHIVNDKVHGNFMNSEKIGLLFGKYLDIFTIIKVHLINNYKQLMLRIHSSSYMMEVICFKKNRLIL